MKKTKVLVPSEFIEQKIYLIRGVKVMLDVDLAKLYQVPTKRLNEAVKRNLLRFPEDFMFQLTVNETKNLRSQIATLEKGHGKYSKYYPYAFTEQGVAMLSSVLKSKRAIDMSIAIVRAFIKLRELLASHKDLILEVNKIKKDQKNQNSKIEAIIDIINRLLAPEHSAKKEKMGFSDRRKKN